MGSTEVLSAVVYEAGLLRAVELSRFGSTSSRIASVALVFERLRLLISVDPSSDEVVLMCGDRSPDSRSVLHDVSREDPWREMIGQDLPWSWILTNQQNYTDGVRFEFPSGDDSHGFSFELIAAASALRVYVPRRVG
ncbi:MAG: hypothetical protein HOW73_48265 [Polyangiaceae bacterium]|nr:hypothetical protein [Polyangiaceae bacterium]